MRYPTVGSLKNIAVMKNPVIEAIIRIRFMPGKSDPFDLITVQAYEQSCYSRIGKWYLLFSLNQ